MTHERKSMPTFTGLILCGGQSSRMGQPKAWLPFRGQTFLQHTCQVMSQVVSKVFIVAAIGQELPTLEQEHLVLRDQTPDEGPLRGIVTGLGHIDFLADAALVTSCDMPLLTVNACQWLMDEFVREPADVLCPTIHGTRQPLFSIYARNVAIKMEQALKAGNRSIKAVLAEVHTRYIEVPTPWRACLRNVNTPEEYRQIIQEDAGMG